MPTVGEDINWIQGILQDAATIGDDGLLWTREDILESYNDAYRQLLTRSQAVKHWSILDVPGRFTLTATQEWESRYASGGSFWKWTWTGGDYECTSLWEVEALENLETQASAEGVTQEWERFLVNPDGQYYRFALPRNNERIVAMWYDHRRLMSLEVVEMDQLWRNWMSLGNYPLAWIIGTGRSRTFDLYEIVTTYQQGYSQIDSWPFGVARSFAGTRTWTTADSQLYGIPRTVLSPDRQYLVQTDGWGLPRDWHSSAGSLLILEMIAPDIPDLQEDEIPSLIPAQCQKYLRFGTLAAAWEKQGEGYQLELSTLCRTMFDRGVTLMRKLADYLRYSADMQRKPTGMATRYRPPRVILPATYPRVWR